MKDLKGNIITNEDDNQKKWKEHFETITQRRTTVKADIKQVEEDLDININSPSIEEVRDSMKQMTNGKWQTVSSSAPRISA